MPARQLLAALAATLSLAAPASAATSTTQGYIPVSDGVTLAYQVVLPDPAVHGPGPYPTLLDYSGYGPGRTVNYDLDRRYVERGYALAGVNIRGTGCSGGKFDYFEERESVDGKEAIEWLASQPWSNGRLAMVNKSYPGITQLFVAAQRPKGLVAIAPGHVFGDLYRDVPYPGGILNETFAGGWSLAVQPTGSYPQAASGVAAGDQQCVANQAEHAPNARYNPFVQAFEHLYDDELFRTRSPYEFADRIDVPVLLVEAWQDEQVGSRAANLSERFSDDIPWRLLASNGDHGEYYGESVQREVREFFDVWVKEAGGAEAQAAWASEPRVQLQWEKGADQEPRFTTGHDAFPPADARVERFFLRAGGRLSGARPPALGEAASTSYAYAPYAGTHNQIWSQASPPSGTAAAFTTAPLTRDLAWVGTASADLVLASTAPDTDLEVLVSEVRPDGQEVYVQRGWLRASHRKLDPARTTAVRPYQTHRQADAALLTPGTPAAMRVEVFPTAHLFRAGSRIRVWIEAPAAFSGLWGFAALPVPARNSVFHTAATPSSIAFPVTDATGAPASRPSCADLRSQPCRPDPLG
jgi:putative CocE/NonD family hydrolase